jgi:tRNA modification GTPase
MSENRVSVLTPPGSAAIAVLSISGPDAWSVLKSHFRSANSRALPEFASKSAFRFGRFGEGAGDEVILVVHDQERFELHCHGGRRIVASLLALLRSAGFAEVAGSERPLPEFANAIAGSLLPFARTARTASILLDQAQGAYDIAVAAADPAMEEILRRNSRVGRHLIEPWTVAIAGEPNAGKSTLVNALAGFDRSVVSPIPGTTRDALVVSLAVDGWPVNVIDTAGLRESEDMLEREGVNRAEAAIRTCDLCLWIVDASQPRPNSVEQVATRLNRCAPDVLVVFNKMDLVEVAATELPEAARVSAATGIGIAELAARIATVLVPNPPRPGEPVPFIPEQCDRWS